MASINTRVDQMKVDGGLGAGMLFFFICQPRSTELIERNQVSSNFELAVRSGMGKVMKFSSPL